MEFSSAMSANCHPDPNYTSPFNQNECSNRYNQAGQTARPKMPFGSDNSNSATHRAVLSPVFIIILKTYLTYKSRQLLLGAATPQLPQPQRPNHETVQHVEVQLRARRDDTTVAAAAATQYVAQLKLMGATPVAVAAVNRR